MNRGIFAPAASHSPLDGHIGEHQHGRADSENHRDVDEVRNGDSEEGVDDGAPSRPGLRRQRGITPPWREHAIPELRNRPDRKTRTFHA